MSTKINYSSYGNTVDGTNYCSGVETLAENIIEDNEEDAVITFPAKDGWASMRSTAYRMTDENTEAIVPLPIYKIRKIEIKIPDFSIEFKSAKNHTVQFSDFKDSAGNTFPTEFDISEFVVNASEWNALPLAESATEYIAGHYKDNTAHWQDGGNVILFYGPTNKFGVSIWADEDKLHQRLLKTLFNQRGGYDFCVTVDDGIDLTVHLSGLANIGADLYSDIRDWQFRIEYVPVSSKTKMRARKSAKTKVDYIQPFNQRAEINAASAFGKNMYLTAQKTGVKEIKVVKNYTDLSKIPPLGARVKHNGKTYRLVANSYRLTNTVFVQVTHTLSENWSMKSKHVAVDQKYRNWKIPQDTLWRNLYWEDYGVFSFEDPAETGAETDTGGMTTWQVILGLARKQSTYYKTIDTMFWSGLDSKGYGISIDVLAPCSTYGMANSMVFSASMQDNLSAGLKMADLTTDPVCAETPYCLADGTLDSARVRLSAGVANGTYTNEVLDTTIDEAAAEAVRLNASWAYPMALKNGVFTDSEGNDVIYTLNVPKLVLFDKSFKILKDPGEALKFTYQLHFVTDSPEIVIGNKFAESNPLIKRYEEDRKFFVFATNRYLREGEEKIALKRSEYIGQAYNNYAFAVQEYEKTDGETGTGKYVSIELTYGRTAWADRVSWGICEGDESTGVFDLLLGCNSMEKTKIYFTVRHNR